jgi:hypothetical protein
MAHRHQHAAQHDRARAPEQAVAEQAAEHRREIDEAHIETENLRRQRLRRQRPRDGFDGGAQAGKARDVFDMSGQKQLLDHVKHQQRLHAVKRDAVPHSVPAMYRSPRGCPNGSAVAAAKESLPHGDSRIAIPPPELASLLRAPPFPRPSAPRAVSLHHIESCAIQKRSQDTGRHSRDWRFAGRRSEGNGLSFRHAIKSSGSPNDAIGCWVRRCLACGVAEPISMRYTDVPDSSGYVRAYLQLGD